MDNEQELNSVGVTRCPFCGKLYSIGSSHFCPSQGNLLVSEIFNPAYNKQESQKKELLAICEIPKYKVNWFKQMREIIEQFLPYIVYMRRVFSKIPKNCDSTFYHTLSYEGDRKEYFKLRRLHRNIKCILKEMDNESELINKLKE